MTTAYGMNLKDIANSQKYTKIIWLPVWIFDETRYLWKAVKTCGAFIKGNAIVNNEGPHSV